MVLAASRKNRVKLFKVATLQRQAHLQPCNVPFSGSDKVWTGLQGCPFQRTALAPRRAQNLLAGCIFDGLACQKCFCVTFAESNKGKVSSSYEEYYLFRFSPNTEVNIKCLIRINFHLSYLILIASVSTQAGLNPLLIAIF